MTHESTFENYKQTLKTADIPTLEKELVTLIKVQPKFAPHMQAVVEELESRGARIAASGYNFLSTEAMDGTHVKLSDGFESRHYPHWDIQHWVEMPLCTPEWRDSDERYYWRNQDSHGEVGGVNFRPCYLHPEESRIVLERLREAYPHIKFRLVVRLEVEKDLEI